MSYSRLFVRLSHLHCLPILGEHVKAFSPPFQILTLLESNIRRDYLSSDFETTSELLGLSNASGCAVDDSLVAGSVPVLPWIPQTTAAVAIRLIELDASISYMLHQKLDSHKEKGVGDFIVSIIFLLY